MGPTVQCVEVASLGRYIGGKSSLYKCYYAGMSSCLICGWFAPQGAQEMSTSWAQPFSTLSWCVSNGETILSLSLACTNFFKTPRKPPNKVVGIIERFKNLLMCFWIGTNNNQPREGFFLLWWTFHFVLPIHKLLSHFFEFFYLNWLRCLCVLAKLLWLTFSLQIFKNSKKESWTKEKRFFLDKSKSYWDTSLVLTKNLFKKMVAMQADFAVFTIFISVDLVKSIFIGLWNYSISLCNSSTSCCEKQL